MGEQDIFAIHGQGQKEGGTQQRRKRAPKNITGENNWKSRGVGGSTGCTINEQ